jgi:hypothetical protein
MGGVDLHLVELGLGATAHHCAVVEGYRDEADLRRRPPGGAVDRHAVGLFDLLVLLDLVADAQVAQDA